MQEVSDRVLQCHNSLKSASTCRFSGFRLSRYTNKLVDARRFRATAQDAQGLAYSRGV